MRCSSGGPRFGDTANGFGAGCQPCALMSAEVCRLAKLPGGASTLDRGCGPVGGGGACGRRGDGDDWTVVPAPIDP